VTRRFRSPRERSHAERLMLIVIGWLSVTLGVIGIFLPVLPTTPFLLLAAACFARSSPRFYSWLINHRYLGPYLRLYMSGKGIPRKAKIGIVVVLWLTILPSALLVVPWLWLTILLLLIAAAVTIYIARLPEPVVVRLE
jgi:uncharacterized membrane protein YbaN (DUF454 family)